MTRIKSCVKDELSSGCNAIFIYAIAIAVQDANILRIWARYQGLIDD